MVEMWQRRMELGLMSAVTSAFRHLHPAMAEREVPQVAAWGEANKPRALEMLRILDEQLAGNRFVAGDAYSVADITALVTVDFMKPARVQRPEGLANLERWHKEVASRPSAKA
jgi:glutathione S-transferase